MSCLSTPGAGNPHYATGHNMLLVLSALVIVTVFREISFKIKTGSYKSLCHLFDVKSAADLDDTIDLHNGISRKGQNRSETS